MITGAGFLSAPSNHSIISLNIYKYDIIVCQIKNNNLKKEKLK